MSFREFLEFESIVSLHALSLEELLSDHREIALDLTSRVRVLPHFATFPRTFVFTRQGDCGKLYGR